MKAYLINISISLCFFYWAGTLLAAPVNDDCSNAYVIKEVSGYCSSPKQFTNFGATASGFPNPGCFPSFLVEPDHDVWFRFKAVATSVNISIIGSIAGDPKGTLTFPQFALYEGDCQTGMREVACISDARGYHIAETFIHTLVVGETYYIRVDGRNGKTGTFQLCLNNFNPVPSPSSDCVTGVVLCDKSPFTVPNVNGAGLHTRELIPGMCIGEESSSAWYKWTCEKPGNLWFTLKPVNPADDIDFLLFFLPNGVEDCSIKVPIRCMASGEEVGASFDNWSRCSGSTGLRPSATDVVEDPGCQEWDDNFLAAIDMNPGESFALMVNNFHNTGNGFSIQFGGTATFKGPVAHFVVNKLKIEQEETLWVRNKSSFEGGIEQWDWNFGVGAKPQTARGEGPHQVTYSSPGTKSISLSIETGNGCQVTKIREITVLEAPKATQAEPVEDESGDLASEGTAGEELAPTQEHSEERSDTAEAAVGSQVSSDTMIQPPVPTRELISHETLQGENADSVSQWVTYDVHHSATIYFPSDSSSLDADDIEILQQVLVLMNDDPGQIVIVEGHTNNIPSDSYCNELATRRANSVINWLIAKGIPEDQIIRKVMGKKTLGKRDPVFQGRKFYQKAVVKLARKE